MSFTTELPIIFPDFVTHRNLLIFIVSKEYIEKFSTEKVASITDDLCFEEDKIDFFQFLFKSVKDDSIDIFKVLAEDDNVLKRQLTYCVLDRISFVMSDVSDLLTYTHMLELNNSILSGIHDREDVTDVDRTGTVCKYSVIGVFMRKFALAFNCISMEKVLYFMEGFKKVVEHYNILAKSSVSKLNTSSKKIIDKNFTLKRERLSEGQVLSSLENIYKNVDNILFEYNSDPDCTRNLRPTLKKYKEMYPSISDTSFLDHLLTIRNKNLETFEKDIQNKFPAKFLSKEEEIPKALKTLQTINKDSKNVIQAVNLFSYHKKMSEVNLNSAATLLSMGFKDEALLHYTNALFNAKLSKNRDLLDDVKNVGNALMPINDNPNPMVYSKNTDTLSNKTALGNIRMSMLQYLHNSHSSLSELLNLYFTSVAPQRRDITPICVIYLSIIFRSYGFESMANTYMIIAACLESVRRTQNHEQVLVEVFVHLLQSFTASGHFDKAMSLFKSLRSIGGGILCENNQIQSSMLQCYFNNAVLRLDFAKAHISIEKLKHFFLAEYGLRRVQLLFIEDNNVAADRLGNHIISFAIKKRDLLVYNHVSISTGRPTISSSITDHRTSGIAENSLEASVTKEFTTLDDVSSQNWGSRDWAFFECRCRWLMCSQLINRRQLNTAKNHLLALTELATKFCFYQFVRLSQLLKLALSNCEHESGPPLALCPLSATTNRKRAESILSSRMPLSTKNHMIFVNLLLKLFVYRASVTRDALFESQLDQLTDYCVKCGDSVGQVHCWQMGFYYGAACGDEAVKVRAKGELEFLLQNRFASVQNLDFLSNIL